MDKADFIIKPFINSLQVKNWHQLTDQRWTEIIRRLEDLHQKTGIDRKELKAAFDKIVVPLWKKEKEFL